MSSTVGSGSWNTLLGVRVFVFGEDSDKSCLRNTEKGKNMLSIINIYILERIRNNLQVNHPHTISYQKYVMMVQFYTVRILHSLYNSNLTLPSRRQRFSRSRR